MSAVTRLSVNVNKIAWLRNARGGNLPDLVQVSKDCERFGAEGITVHPRPDERHITRADVYALKEVVSTEFNIEGYPSEDFLQLVEAVRPDQVTLVPDPPDALTSNAGWDTRMNASLLKEVVSRLHEADCRVSIFMETNPDFIDGAKEVGTDRIEFYTGPYAEHFEADREAAIGDYVSAARHAALIGLGINAGHDLSTRNLSYWAERIPQTLEVSIGHALWSDALYWGMENTIQLYRRCLVSTAEQLAD